MVSGLRLAVGGYRYNALGSPDCASDGVLPLTDEKLRQASGPRRRPQEDLPAEFTQSS